MSFVQHAAIGALRDGETFIQAMPAEYAAGGDIIAASRQHLRLFFAISISTIEDGLDRLSAGPP